MRWTGYIYLGLWSFVLAAALTMLLLINWARAEEAAPVAEPSAEVLREQIRELEQQIEVARTQVRLRSAELAVAKGRLRAQEKRQKR